MAQTIPENYFRWLTECSNTQIVKGSRHGSCVDHAALSKIIGGLDKDGLMNASSRTDQWRLDGQTMSVYQGDCEVKLPPDGMKWLRR